MTISEVTEKINISSHTLRYYEKLGIIAPIRRTSSGLRDYTDSDLNRIEFALCMRRAGIPIEALRKYCSLVLQGESTYEERLDLLLSEKNNLEEKIAEFQSSLDYLNIKIQHHEEKISLRNTNKELPSTAN